MDYNLINTAMEQPYLYTAIYSRQQARTIFRNFLVFNQFQVSKPTDVKDVVIATSFPSIPNINPPGSWFKMEKWQYVKITRIERSTWM